MYQSYRMQSATAAAAVDLSGDGGVTREMVREGTGKGLATGDIAMVRFTGKVAETGQVRTRALGWYPFWAFFCCVSSCKSGGE